MVRASDSSSVDESIDESEAVPPVERNFDELETNSIQRDQPEAKGRVLSVIEKACFSIGRTVSSVHHRSDLVSERVGSEVEKKVKKHGKSLSERKLGTKLSNRLYEEFVCDRWPSWLILYAADAIEGWTPRREDSFEKLDKIEKGRHGLMYKARDSLTGKLVALEEVRLDIHVDIKSLAKEILILRRLDHPNVIKLEGLVTSRMSPSVYLLFEYMEHNLSGLAISRGIKFTVPQVKCYSHQLLSGLEYCHNHGVLHRDINGSNLLLDNQGTLKIANFERATFFDPKHVGATFFDPNYEHPMTSHMVSLRYRAPEILLGAVNYGIGIDLWSAGCILAELLAGRPIMLGHTEVEQLHKIFKLCGSPSKEYWRKLKLPGTPIFKPHHPYRRCLVETFKNFPPLSLPLIETLLAYDPAERRTATAALQSEFFTTEPCACEHSTLLQYPTRIKIDAKLQDDVPKRQTAPSSKANGEGTRSTSKYTRITSKILQPVRAARDSANLDVCQLPGRHANVAMSRDKFPDRYKDKAAASTSTSSCPCHPSPSPVSRPPDVFYSPPGLTKRKITMWSGFDTPVIYVKHPPFAQLPELSKKSPSLHKNRAVGLPLGSSPHYNPSFGPDASHCSMALHSPRGALQSATVLETVEYSGRERFPRGHKDGPVNFALDSPHHSCSSPGSDFSFTQATLITPREWWLSTPLLDTLASDSQRPKKYEPQEMDHKR